MKNAFFYELMYKSVVQILCLKKAFGFDYVTLPKGRFFMQPGAKRVREGNARREKS